MLKETLQTHLKEAMRAKDQARLRTIRALRAALMDAEIAERKGGTASLSDAQEMAVVQKQAKQRRDALEQYKAAGRDDLAVIEEEELAVLKDYLPEQMDESKVREIVSAVISETGAESMRDMGKVMGGVMPRVKGKADGKLVQSLVKELLGSS